MRMYDIVNFQQFYTIIETKKMPIKTTYKLAKLKKALESEVEIYQTELTKIIQEYAQKDADGNYIYTEDKKSIKIIPGSEKECNLKLLELQNLEIHIEDIKFDISEFEELELSLNDINFLMPFIQ